jgi:hypothetical protein
MAGCGSWLVRKRQDFDLTGILGLGILWVEIIMDKIGGCGPVEKVPQPGFEIATACSAGLAMTPERDFCHCGEQRDEAISGFSTVPLSLVFCR